MRVLHANNVFVLGPEANHFVLVSGAKHFGWRDGGFGDLIPLLGDGLLTIDGDFHRSSRRTMLPAFHRERIAGYRAVMEEEAAARRSRAGATARRSTSTPGRGALALRVAMRALFGFDPDAGRGATDAARDFERALVLLRRGLLAAGAARPAHAVRAADAPRAGGSTSSSTARSPAGARRARAGRTCCRC